MNILYIVISCITGLLVAIGLFIYGLCEASAYADDKLGIRFLGDGE